MSGLLQHSGADIVAQSFIDSGLATDPDVASSGWPVRVDVVPDSPDDNLTVKNTAGRSWGSSQIDGTVARDYGVQVTVRSTKSNVGAAKAHALQDAMERLIYGMNVTIGAASYKLNCFTDVGDVLAVGFDAGSNRFIHTINVTASIRAL